MDIKEKMKVLGISGSPIKNSNLDRLIQVILNASEMEADFIKLSRFNFSPCHGCLKCADTNHCIQKDDWHKIEEKILEAQAVIIGGYATYNTMDAWTKTLFERMFSFRHQKNILRGKIGVAVGMGYKCEEFGYEGQPGAEIVADYIEAILKGYELKVIGKVAGQGNPSCLSCGFGEICNYSNVIKIWGKGALVTEDKFNRIEDQKETIAKARILGEQIKKICGSSATKAQRRNMNDKT